MSETAAEYTVNSSHGQSQTDKEEGCQDGVSYGPGFTISWQRGPLAEGRNGAFLLDILEACRGQLVAHQDSKFVFDENAQAPRSINYGPGFAVFWQHGPLAKGRNGALILDVLEVCRSQLTAYQDSKFACNENAQALKHLDQAIAFLKCNENAQALEHLKQAIAFLEQRRDRREAEGKLGTHEV